MKFKNKKLGIKLSIIASILGIGATGSALLLENNVSFQKNYINNTSQTNNTILDDDGLSKQLKDSNHPLNRINKKNNLEYLLNYSNSIYAKFNNSPVNIKPWKELFTSLPVIQNKYIALNINELNNNGTTLDILISEISTTSNQGNIYTDKQPNIVSIDFGKLAYSRPGSNGQLGMGAFTKAYYSGGIFDEANACFIVCISLYDNSIGIWTPVLFRFDTNNLTNPYVLENNSFKSHGFIVSHNETNNKNLRYMAYKSDNPFDFNIVPYFKAFDDKNDDTETKDSFYLIYKYDCKYMFTNHASNTYPYESKNSLLCDKKVFFENTEYSQWIWSGTFSITKNKTINFFPTWFKETGTQVPWSQYYALYMFNIRPILLERGNLKERYLLIVTADQDENDINKDFKNITNIYFVDWNITLIDAEEIKISDGKNKKLQNLYQRPNEKIFANQSRYIYLKSYENLTTKKYQDHFHNVYDSPIWVEHALSFSYFYSTNYGNNDKNSTSIVCNTTIGYSGTKLNFGSGAIDGTAYYSWNLNIENKIKFNIGRIYIVDNEKNKRFFFTGSNHYIENLGLTKKNNVDFFGSIDFSEFLNWCKNDPIPSSKDFGNYNFDVLLKKQLFETKQAWISFVNTDLSKPIDLVNYVKGVCFAPPILAFKTANNSDTTLAYLHKEFDANNQIKNASLVPLKAYIAMLRNDVSEKPIGQITSKTYVKNITLEMLNSALYDLFKNNELCFSNIYANNINPNSSNEEKINQFYTDWNNEKWYSTIKAEILPFNEQDIPKTLKFRIKIKDESILSNASIANNANTLFLNSEYQNEPDIFYITGLKRFDDTILNQPAELLVPGMSETDAATYTKDQALKILNEKKEEIFSNLPNNTTISITEYNSNPNSNLDGEILLKITIDKYYKDDEECKGPSQEFDFKLIGFKKINNDTILSTNSITWNDQLFKDIFVHNKGFVEDWSKEFNEGKLNLYVETLKQYMNNSIDKFFTNTYHTTVSNVTMGTIENNVLKATITFSGVNNKQIDQNMQATLSINLRSKPKSDDPLFNDFQDYMQNRINQNHNVLPDNQILNNWVSDYLNQEKILNNIPNACIPNNGNSNFVNTNVIISSMQNEQIPINVSFKTKGFDIIELELPLINLTFAITEPNKIIAATSPINEYTTLLVIKKWNQDKNSQEINIIKQWMNDHIASIFNIVPTNASITQINSIEKTSNIDELVFKVTLSNAYTSKGIVVNKEFSFTINKFNKNINETNLKPITINYQDPLFKDIFVNDKAFAVDWKYDCAKQKNQLQTYINNHIPDFFESYPNPNDYEDVKVNSLEFTIDEQTNSCSVAIIYSGFNNTGWSDTIQGNITINLRSINDIDSILAKVQINIQNWINQNYHFPKDDELKQIVSDFLNEHKNDLPNVCIPSNGTSNFSSNDILINNLPSKDKTTGNVSFNLGDIVTINQIKNIEFPAIKNNVVLTKFKDNQVININGFKEDYPIDDVVEIINNKIQPTYDFVLDQVRQHAKGTDGYLENYEYGNLNDINITHAEIDNVTGNIVVDITIDNARGIDGLITLSDKKLMISKDCFATGLENLLNIKTIGWDTKIFKAIFTNQDHGFYEDWSNPEITNLNDKAFILMNYINQAKNVSSFFTNTNYIKKPKVTNATIDLTKPEVSSFSLETSITVTINYSGYKNGKYTNDNVDYIKLILRTLDTKPTKDFVDTANIETDPESFNIYDQIQSAIASNIVNNNGALPTEQELAKLVANTINRNKEHIPYSWLPNNGKNKPIITAEDIFIDSSLIIKKDQETLDLNYHFAKGAIGIKKSSTETNLFPSLGTMLYKNPRPRSQNTPWWIICIEICIGAGILLLILVLVLVFYFKS